MSDARVTGLVSALPRRTRATIDDHVGDVDETRLLDRELSWLSFNERVLALAARQDWPVVERATFLAIFATNLDEFFQVRVAGLLDRIEADVAPFPGRMTPAETLAAVLPEVRRLTQLQADLFHHDVLPALDAHGLPFTTPARLEPDDQALLDQEFEQQIFPVLTPLAVDPAHPFPYLSNLSLNLAVLLRTPDDEAPRFARVKIPSSLPRFIELPPRDGGRRRYVPLESIVATHLHRLFPGLEVVGHHAFRVTRDADLTSVQNLDRDDDDLMDVIEEGLSQQRRGQRAVRLEIEPGMPDDVRDLLLAELRLDAAHVFELPGPLDLGGLWAIADGAHPPLTHPRFSRVVPAPLDVDEPREVFAALRRRDVLLHHPYDDFDRTVLMFIDAAADDPDVLAIKLTLYRTAGDSPIVEALVRAAQAGKQVVALVELTARFDEASNVRWARHLEEVGVHVAYGVVGLKTHTKTALVVRREGDRLRRYGHVGTGNYHHRTARLYEDVGLLTADPDVGADLTDLFNALTGYGRHGQYRRLVTAPTRLRSHMVDLIAREASEPDGHVVLKMNSLVDADVIEALYAASDAGTRIDLLVRGICCLRPGVPGLSDHVRVRSVVGRYLEHSRIYRFGSTARGRTHLIGSGDMMPRNLDRRVEACIDVPDPVAAARLDEILDELLDDTSLAWELDADGSWHRTGEDDVTQPDVHQRLEQSARRHARAGVA